MIPVLDTGEEEDVPLINSLDIMSVQEQPAIPETTGQPTQTPEKSEEDRLITIFDSDHDKEEEDFEMLEYSDSFWENGQRLTDSWYEIKNPTGEFILDDDDDDDICAQGLLNVENDNNNLNYNGDIDDDDDDDIYVQGLSNMENNNFVIDSAKDDDDIDDDDEFDTDLDKLMENHKY